MDRYLFAILGVFMLAGWVAAETLAPWRDLVPWLLATIMVATSLRASVADLARVTRRPGTILFILAVLHLAQPLLARLAGVAGFADQPDIIAGLVLTAAIPIGVTSVVWTGLARGDVALALTALTIDTLLSPLVLPGVLTLFAGAEVEFDANRLMVDLLWMVVAPTVLGIWLHERTDGRIADRVQGWAGPAAKLALGAVLAINIANSRHALAALSFPFWRLLLTVLTLVLAGYLGGALLARAIGLPHGAMIAVANAAGLRNISAGIVICMRAFPPLTALPVLLGVFCQQPVAALVRHLSANEAPAEGARGASRNSPRGNSG